MKKVWQVVKASVKRISGIMVHDFTRIFTNPVAAIIAVGVMILPSLYAWFNIQASWDPYGSTNNLSVAVANADKGTTVQKLKLNVGKNIIESLAENDQIGWEFTDKEEALEGVRSGKYYAAVVIPEDFSKNMTSILKPEIKRPQIEYYVNEKKNAIAPKITDKGVSVIQQMVNKTFISESVTVIGDMILGLAGEEGSGLDRKLLENVELGDNIQHVEDTIAALTELNASIDNMVSTIDAFQATADAMDELQQLVATTVDSVSEASKGVQSDGIDTGGSLMDAAESVADSAESTLSSISSMLDGMYSSLEDLETVISSQDSQKAVSILETLKSQAGEIQNISSKLSNTLKDNEYLYQIQAVQEVVKKLEGVNTRLGNFTTAADKMISDIQNSTKQEAVLQELEQLKGFITECQELTDAAKGLFGVDTRAQIDEAASKANAQIGNVKQAASSIQAIGPAAEATMESVNNAMDSLGTSIESMSKVLVRSQKLITNGITELETLKGFLEEIDKQKNISISETIENFVLTKFGVDLKDYKNSPESVGDFLSSPVELKTHKIFPIENYGSALAPFYSILAMWVGGLILVAILKCRAVNDKNLNVENYKPFELYIGRYLIFMIFGVIQSVIVCLGDLYLLKIQCLYPGRFIFVGVVAGIVFSNIIYTLTITFDDVGKAIAVILLVLQVAGAGGTFPIEVTPEFFNVINPFLPFTHGMNAMREAVAGLYGHNYWLSLLKLFVYFPVFYIFGTVFRTPLIKMNEFFAKHVESTGIM